MGLWIPADNIKSAGGVLLTRDVLARGGTRIRYSGRGPVRRCGPGGARAAGRQRRRPGAGGCRTLARPPYLCVRGPEIRALATASGCSAALLAQQRPECGPVHQPPPCPDPAAKSWNLAALPDVLLHALLCLPPLESLAMVECAYNRGDIDPSFLRRHLVGNRCGKARDVLARVESGADRCGTCWPGGRSAGRSRTSPVLELPPGRRGPDAVTEGSKLGQSAGRTRSSGPE